MREEKGKKEGKAYFCVFISPIAKFQSFFKNHSQCCLLQKVINKDPIFLSSPLLFYPWDPLSSGDIVHMIMGMQ